MSQFFATLAHLNKKGTITELDTELANLIQQIRLTNKKGEISLKLTIKPNGEDGQVAIEDKIVVNVPKPPRKPAVFFTSPDGRIQRNPFEQEELPLEDMGGGKSLPSPVAQAAAQS